VGIVAIVNDCRMLWQREIIGKLEQIGGKIMDSLRVILVLVASRTSGELVFLRDLQRCRRWTELPKSGMRIVGSWPVNVDQDISGPCMNSMRPRFCSRWIERHSSRRLRHTQSNDYILNISKSSSEGLPITTLPNFSATFLCRKPIDYIFSE
jgi:hypothetical protein